MSKKHSEKKEMIHVLYALVDKTGNYSKLAGTSICSLFENTNEKVTVHLFHDGSIKDRNKENFIKLAKKYGQKLMFYNVHELLPDVWREAKDIFAEALQSAQYTEATMYRLVAAQILPESIHRLIYIDADTIVNIDIKELWQEKIGVNGLAAVRESTLLSHYGMKGIGESREPMYNRMRDRGVSLETCFNAGILLIDMVKIRSLGNILLSGLRIICKYPEENKFYDQNILNYYFARDLNPLPWNYNILLLWDKEHGNAIPVKGIYHYMGKTLTMNGFDGRDTMFYDYFFKTPWFTGEFYCRSNMVMREVYLQLLGPRMRAMRKLTSLMAVKKMVVTTTRENENIVAKLYSSPNDFDIEEVKEKQDFWVKNVEEYKKEKKDEEIKKKEANKTYSLPKNILKCSLGSEDDLQIELPYDVNEYFYVVFANKYSLVKNMLTYAGLKENEHFMSGAFLLVGKPWLENIIIPNKFFEML